MFGCVTANGFRISQLILKWAMDVNVEGVPHNVSINTKLWRLKPSHLLIIIWLKEREQWETVEERKGLVCHTPLLSKPRTTDEANHFQIRLRCNILRRQHQVLMLGWVFFWMGRSGRRFSQRTHTGGEFTMTLVHNDLAASYLTPL